MAKRKKIKEKNPFIGFTLEELEKIEMTYYTISIGMDFYSYDGYYTFSKEEVGPVYDEILNDLKSVIKNPKSKKSKEDAIRYLGTLRVQPFRLQ